MNTIIMYKQMKNGKWRLYRNESQAITAWRGSNDKITTVRDDLGSGRIINFASKEDACEYAKTVLKTSAYEWCDN